MPVKKLETIDADTLLGIPYEPPAFVVEDLLPQGLHLLAGAPKIGKSWLALWLCLRVAQGQPLWDFATRPCEVLYLCLEDSFQRIQNRLFDLTEDAPPALHFAVMAEQLRSGLVEQIEQFLREHPATGLVVIDTLQCIRGAGSEVNSYASDYQDIGVLKALADRHRIAVLLVHHLRKLSDDDPISCQWETAATTSTGITGFSINGVAGAVNNTTNTITITMPRGTDVTKLTPVIATNGVKSLTPGSGETVDFTNSVTYTAIMEDGSTHERDSYSPTGGPSCAGHLCPLSGRGILQRHHRPSERKRPALRRGQALEQEYGGSYFGGQPLRRYRTISGNPFCRAATGSSPAPVRA